MKKLVLIITILFSLTSLNISFAETSGETLEKLETQLHTQPMSSCYGVFVPAMDIHKIEFQTFLDETFRNKSSNSSLINIAIARFTQYRLSLEGLFALIRPAVDYESPNKESDLSQEDQWGQILDKRLTPTDYSEYAQCKEIMDTYIEDAKNMMIEHIKNNTAQKKTITILEKYEALNEKMKTLNFEIAQMYGYFATFKDKLHWINGKCVQ